MKKGTLYLIPIHLGGTDVDKVAVPQAQAVSQKLRHFIVEDVRTSRRYLSKLKHPDISGCTFFELNKHTNPKDLNNFIRPLIDGKDLGVMSEAGCPGVADPGAEIVRRAHEKNIPVVPIVGANSILLTLMASGMNGQRFTFHGYLPRDRSARKNGIRKLESLISEGSQIFMEAPFRNNHILEDVLALCQPDVKLCIGTMLTTEEESVKTKTIGAWRKSHPDIHKKPTIFILGS